MQFYATTPSRRIRQVLADVVAIVVIVLAIVLGTAVGRSIAALGAVGERMESAGSGFRSTMSDAAKRLADVPFGGQALGAPFRKASDAAAGLASAGRDQQAAAEHTAILVGLVIAILPSLVVLALWAFARGGFIRRAAAIRALLRTPLGVEALAARALAHADARSLRDADASLVERWRAGDPAAVSTLARIALRRAGVPDRPLGQAPQRTDGSGMSQA
ncbi:hypothetical protein [Curtobacterium sp. Leaf261]|uniref:hypothetical protein n=1 Tax=Curtobacterium sp. Leaf261 TaxID=1736311 RepID=UPI0006FCD44E|nr:hypothetical protein [Curtobacterium sp. Leaf261]KQO61214.1 hypothetical protein ASF23_12015 [Curtobacterium sp. Leaf261]